MSDIDKYIKPQQFEVKKRTNYTSAFKTKLVLELLQNELNHVSGQGNCRKGVVRKKARQLGLI